jgi:hypothetical protein
MLSLPAGPEGFRSSGTESSYDAENRAISHRVEFEHPDGRTFVIEQRIRAGGPSSVPTGRPVPVGTQTAHLTEANGELSLTWSIGDLIVRVASNSLAEDDLLAIAASLQAAP